MMTVDIKVVAQSGRRLKGAVARPGGPGLHPGVVVIHEVFGDQPEMRPSATTSPGMATWR